MSGQPRSGPLWAVFRLKHFFTISSKERLLTRHRFSKGVHISFIVRRVWCQVNRHRLYENHELYSGRRILTVLIIKLQWKLRSIRNKSEFNTVLGEEHYGQDENNKIVPARRMVELVAHSIQLGHPSSWTVCFLVPGFVSL